MQACRSRREMRQIFKVFKKIQMNQKEAFNSTVEDHDLNLLVSFDCRDDLVHLRKHLRTEDVEWRMVNRDSPVVPRAPGPRYLGVLCWYVTLMLHVCCLLIACAHGL